MTIITHHVKTIAIQSVGQDGGNHIHKVSLRGPDGWELMIDNDRAHTAPPQRMVTGSATWLDDPLLRGAARRADRMTQRRVSDD